MGMQAERQRLEQDARREKNWKRWGPYLSERQWGTVREDYSPEGDSWSDISHDDARSRAYRWGEDGLLGFTDRRCRLCFALALWNEQDPILKERLFGLTGPQGNHGEDVKELYYYLDATPTYAYARALYKYPQAAFPYDRLRDENQRRDKKTPEFELVDTGVFDEGRYFDVFAEYAKADDNDLLIRLTVHNRGPDVAPLHLLPTVWFRNTWAWGRTGDGYWPEPKITDDSGATPQLNLAHFSSLPAMRLVAETPADVLFTRNETNLARLFDAPNEAPYTKDAFHRYVVDGDHDAIDPDRIGTKAALHYRWLIPAGASRQIRLRLCEAASCPTAPFEAFDAVFDARQSEANDFYASLGNEALSEDEQRVCRQSYAGLLHTNQFYHLVVRHWLDGDPSQPSPKRQPSQTRNAEWRHLFNLDVLSMPDKWEYPWYAAWDLAFHMIPYARLDPAFAKHQLQLMLREWYMHPNGQIPAYEFKFDDVNPPVHAWAVWRVYQIEAAQGTPDVRWLSSCFQKLLLNYGWWINRKDPDGNNLFGGGFLGLDNIGVFDRSRPLPGGARLDQADGTAWMAFFAGNMLRIALELAQHDRSHADMASRFFEHFVEIVDAMNHLGGHGLWDETDGFYYDHLVVKGEVHPLRTRSLVGLAPLFTAQVLDQALIDPLPGFSKRLRWFLDNRRELHRTISYMEIGSQGQRLLAVPTRERLERTLVHMLDENEFLSPYGIRSLSRAHLQAPFRFVVDGHAQEVAYNPAESDSYMFGGNSNWRGPVWFPLNFLLIEALETYGRFYGDKLTVEHPTGSGRRMTLDAVARDLAHRLSRLFVADANGRRPCHGSDSRYSEDPAFKDLVLFYEYFDGDNGRGCGASHQTGWTAL
ncbi:MAG: glucosidase, partial [Myxococcota bacterium]